MCIRDRVLTTCTLGGTKDNQLMDDLTDEQTKRYIHHYNFCLLYTSRCV